MNSRVMVFLSCLNRIMRRMTAVVAVALPFCFAMSVYAQTPDVVPTPLFERQHQAGVRLGGWANQGGLPPYEFTDPNGGRVTTDINDGSFYVEGFFAYRFSSFTQGEVSFGFANRGNVTTRTSGLNDIGTLNVYPILLQLKIYSPAPLMGKLYPYISAGGGIYYARNSVQISNDIYYVELRESSATDFNYTVGGGVDWPIASSVGLGLNVKYMPISFNDELLEVRDWSAVTISLGVKYLYQMTGRDNDNRRRRR